MTQLYANLETENSFAIKDYDNTGKRSFARSDSAAEILRESVVLKR